MISSYVGENKEFERQYLAGELEVEFLPAGHARRTLPRGGAAFAASTPRPASARLVAEGKEVKNFDGQDYILERGIFADPATIKSWKADESGNLFPQDRAQLQPADGDSGESASPRSTKSCRPATSIPTASTCPASM